MSDGTQKTLPPQTGRRVRSTRRLAVARGAGAVASGVGIAAGAVGSAAAHH